MVGERELSTYLFFPRSSARELLALGRLLLRAAPAGSSPPLERAAAKLELELDSFMAGLRLWRDSESESEALAKEELDFAADGLWKIFAERLEQWAVFQRRAFAKLADAQVRSFDYAARVAKAERARHLQCHLLGGLGTGLGSLSYEAQAEFMATLWTVVDKEGLEQEFADLVGHDFVAALRDCQSRYRLLIEARGQAWSPDFRLNERRDRLQRRLVLYVAALVALLDEDDPESVMNTRAALVPVDMLRELDARSAGAIAHEGHEELEIDPLLAELDSIDLALGFDTGDHIDHALSENSGSWSSV